MFIYECMKLLKLINLVIDIEGEQRGHVHDESRRSCCVPAPLSGYGNDPPVSRLGRHSHIASVAYRTRNGAQQAPPALEVLYFCLLNLMNISNVINLNSSYI